MDAPEKEKRQDDRKGGWRAHLQLLVVLVFITAAFTLSQLIGKGDRTMPQPEKSRPVLVLAATVKPQMRPVIFSRTGTVEVNGQINIVPQVSGRIVAVHDNFNDGSVFNADTVLFNIESADFQNQVDIAAAEVERAETSLALQIAEREAAIADWKSLNPDKPPPPLVAKEPQLRQARAALKAAKARLANAKLDLSRTAVSYPFPGRVIDTNIEIGQYVQAGQSYGTAYPGNSLEIKVPVEDRVLRFIDPDKTQVIIKTSYQGEELELHGRIDRIGSELDRQTRFVNLIITPRGDNWDKLLPGVFVTVELIGKEITDLWELPNDVIQGKNGVWIISDDNTLRFYEPEILSVRGDITLARGNGRKERLVKGLLKGASNGMKVRVSEEETTDTDTTSSDQGVIVPSPPAGKDKERNESGMRQ